MRFATKPVFWALLLFAFPALAGGGGGGDHGIIFDIALCVVSASILGLIVNALKQPLILGYLLAGIAIGPIGLRFITEAAAIKTVSEIGLVLLLFMIGLEIDLKKMLSAGRLVILPGLLQVPLCIGLGWLGFWGLSELGFSFGSGKFALLYCAVAISLSSTMIVVKLLFDKMELDTLPGRITVGILVFQDIWAIIALIIQPNLANPALGEIAFTFMRGGLLVGIALLTSKYILPRVFRASAKLPELMLVMSLGWCFLVSVVAAHPSVGLSMEMGALIAGISLATFPYNLDVIAKVVSIRDFFITLFFVALGMQIPMPETQVLLTAAAFAGVVLLVKGGVLFGILYALRAGHRVSLLASLNLAQISEFSLVILSLGVAFGHIGTDTLTISIWVFSILAVASTYFGVFSHPLQNFLSGVLKRIGLKDLGGNDKDDGPDHDYPVVMLGFFRIASAFLEQARINDPDILNQVMVVDFNPEVRERLKAMNVACVYGDVSHQETLHHARIHNAKLVLCTIPDFLLKGTNNRKLLELTRRICPHAQVVLTADSDTQARQLYEAGADFVLTPSTLSGAHLVSATRAALSNKLEEMRGDEEGELSARKEVLS